MERRASRQYSHEEHDRHRAADEKRERRRPREGAILEVDPERIEVEETAANSGANTRSRMSHVPVLTSANPSSPPRSGGCGARILSAGRSAARFLAAARPLPANACP